MFEVDSIVTEIELLTVEFLLASLLLFVPCRSDFKRTRIGGCRTCGEGCRKVRRVDSSTRDWRVDGGRILSLMVSMHFGPVLVILDHPSPTTVHCDCGGNKTGDEGEVGVDRFAEVLGFSSGRDGADFVIISFF